MNRLTLKKVAAVSGPFIFAILCHCSPMSTAQTQGPGTEVIGNVAIAGDTGTVQGLVFLREADFLADTTTGGPVIPEARTDKNGAFSIQGVLPGSYSIEVIDTVHGRKRLAVLLKCQVSQSQTQTVLPPAILKSASTVRGSIVEPGGDVWVQVYGLERLAKVDPVSGAFTIRDVPEGEYTLHVTSALPSFTPYDIKGVSTVPGDTVDIPFAGWRFSRHLSFNTTGSGAAVSSNVFGFPVLIRLTKMNFDFSQAQASGSDVRFAKSSGAPLSCEIEQWDAANGHAEIWVRTDTIHGNDSSQSIAMFWGNPSATAISNGALVFDTAEGFKAVWHFSQGANDATYNQMNGTAYGASDSTGVIGGSKFFHGADSIKVPGPINGPANISLSAWVKFDSTDILGSEVISLGDDVVIRVDDPDPTHGTFGSYRFDTAFANYARTTSGLMLKKTGWRHVAYTVDGGSGVQSFYVDGVLSATTQNKSPIYYHSGRNISIGTHGFDWGQPNSDYVKVHFLGSIDEVRICRVARSQDWIKLCYMNQKAQDALVIFK